MFSCKCLLVCLFVSSSSQIFGVHKAVLLAAARNSKARAQDSVPRESPMDGHNVVHLLSVLPNTSIRYNVVGLGRPVLLDPCDHGVE